MKYDRQKSKTYKEIKKDGLFKILDFTLYSLIKDSISNKSVIDLACGEGHLTRKLKKWGAQKVLGIDISEDMINLAHGEKDNPALGVEYLVADVSHLSKIDEFDIATASWLFPYAKNSDQLYDMMSSVTNNLKTNGKFFIVDFIGLLGRLKIDYSEQGFEFIIKSIKNGHAKLKGVNKSPYMEFDLNFYSREIMEENLIKSGFTDIKWHGLILPESLMRNKNTLKIWLEYIANPHSAVIECIKIS